MLNRAGLDLRLELIERDDHDRVLAEWERTLDDANLSNLADALRELVALPPLEAHLASRERRR